MHHHTASSKVTLFAIFFCRDISRGDQTLGLRKTTEVCQLVVKSRLLLDVMRGRNEVGESQTCVVISRLLL